MSFYLKIITSRLDEMSSVFTRSFRCGYQLVFALIYVFVQILLMGFRTSLD